ncbi:GFA family protein [Neorhizobium sp. P12A]|uniref:GFA family protein n=1 Tax=Neorhizobium sp. P12A TaxID=2268027 RepID=UPI0011EF2288|nr:GFA family protein [Neorhizobium sp. P12A]KAA0687978.1 GFA family protein [Neorhizobium sp. P12A]
MHIDGACQCGQVTYKAEIDPGDVTICHCSDCQRLTGTAYRVSVSAVRKNFHITTGDPKEYVKIAQNGRRRMQYFCPNCGSPIYTTGELQDAEQVGIRLGTVNQRQDLKPRAQFWCSSELSWAQDLRTLPRQDD